MKNYIGIFVKFAKRKVVSRTEISRKTRCPLHGHFAMRCTNFINNPSKGKIMIIRGKCPSKTHS